MNAEFLKSVEYDINISEDEYYIYNERPLPITEPPYSVKAFAFFMFLLFCQHMFDNDHGILNYLENKIKTFIKNSLDYYFYGEDNKEPVDEEQSETEIKGDGPKKYEDKYLEEFNKLDEDIVFTEEELLLENDKRVEVRNKLEEELEKTQREFNKVITKVVEEIKMLEEKEEVDKVNFYNQELEKIKDELKKSEAFLITEEEVNNLTREKLVQERLNRLKNNIIMEKTPLGNVIMFYNNEKSSFEYYSDSTIPYRYLEVIGRKYVVTYKCKQIYVDMDKEIKEAEKKLAEKKEKEDEEKKKQEELKTTSKEVPKKNVFAKFKTYNKDTNIKSASVPLDRPAPAKQTDPKEEKIVKERANRYSFEGKLANFNFLKKVDRKAIDKRYALSFTEFKQMQKQNQH
jgi:hypothetical protein